MLRGRTLFNDLVGGGPKEIEKKTISEALLQKKKFKRASSREKKFGKASRKKI